MRKWLVAALLIAPAYGAEPLTKTDLLLCRGAPDQHFKDGGIEIFTYKFATESRRIMVPVQMGTMRTFVAKDLKQTCEAVYTFRDDAPQDSRLKGSCEIMPACK